MQDVLKLARQVSEDFVKMSEDEGNLKPRGMAEVLVSSLHFLWQQCNHRSPGSDSE